MHNFLITCAQQQPSCGGIFCGKFCAHIHATPRLDVGAKPTLSMWYIYIGSCGRVRRGGHLPRGMCGQYPTLLHAHTHTYAHALYFCTRVRRPARTVSTAASRSSTASSRKTRAPLLAPVRARASFHLQILRTIGGCSLFFSFSSFLT